MDSTYQLCALYQWALNQLLWRVWLKRWCSFGYKLLVVHCCVILDVDQHRNFMLCVCVCVCVCVWPHHPADGFGCLLKTCRCTPRPPLAPSSPPLLSSLALCERGKAIGRRSSRRSDNPIPTSPDSCYSARYWSPLELSVNTVWVHQSINNILMFHIAMNRYLAGLIGAAKNNFFCLLILSIDTFKSLGL